MRFFIPCTPPKGTAQQKGACIVGKNIRFFKKKSIKQTEDSLIALFTPYQPPSPIIGSVKIFMQFVYPYRKSEKKAVVSFAANIAHDCRPDVENVAKLALDCLVLLRFIEDDSKVFDLHLLKFWGAKPGITVSIEGLITVSDPKFML